jgi:hypothetical protein
VRSLIALLASLIALAHPAAAGAAAFSFSSQDRFVSLQDVARSTSALETASDFSAFDASLGSGQVAQSSTLDPTQIVVELSHDVVARTQALSGDVAEHFVLESSFEAAFTLDEASDYTLDASFAAPDFITDLNTFFPWFDTQVVLEAALVGPGGTLFAFSFDLQADCEFQEDCSFEQPFAQAGVLAPGSYTLSVRTFAVAESNVICVGFPPLCNMPISDASRSTSRVDLRVVPEPGTAAMLSSGVVALAAFASRQARRRSVRRTSQAAATSSGANAASVESDCDGMSSTIVPVSPAKLVGEFVSST